MRGLCWKTEKMGPSGRPRKMFARYHQEGGECGTCWVWMWSSRSSVRKVKFWQTR